MTEPIQFPQGDIRSSVAPRGRSTWCAHAQSAARVLQTPLALANSRDTSLIALIMAAHVFIWWIVALMLHAPSDVHNDMAEAFSWGQELQWGYYKHPPFWAWIARIWFWVFPAADWAFYLLCVINSAVGLLGVWAIAGRYVRGARRLAAVLLLELVPFYHFLAFNYNANAIELALWPWTIYAFIVSFESRRLVAAVGFGVLAAATMLSKYFGGVLLVSCIVAALTSPHIRDYFRSVAPYVTLIVFGACVAPHVAWLMEAATGPLDYLATKTEYSFFFILEKAATVMAGITLLHGFLMIALVAIWRKAPEPGWGSTLAVARAQLRRPRIRLLTVLAVAPLLVTVVVSLVGNVRLSTKFALPLCSLIPLAWIILHRVKFDVWSMWVVALSINLLVVASLLLAIPVADLKFRKNHRHYAEPRAIVARRVADLWHAHMATPLRIVAGTESYALATTFYSADHPSDFIDFSTTKAPWIDSVRLSREGLAVVCAVDDKMCLGQMEHFKSLSSTRLTLSDVSKRFLGRRGRTFSFEVLLVRPGQTVRIPAADCCDGQPKGERNHLDPDAEGSSDFAALARERLRSAKSESPAAGSLGEL